MGPFQIAKGTLSIERVKNVQCKLRSTIRELSESEVTRFEARQVRERCGKVPRGYSTSSAKLDKGDRLFENSAYGLDETCH